MCLRLIKNKDKKHIRHESMFHSVIQGECGLICVLQLISQLISCRSPCASLKLKANMFDEVLQLFSDCWVKSSSPQPKQHDFTITWFICLVRNVVEAERWVSVNDSWDSRQCHEGKKAGTIIQPPSPPWKHLPKNPELSLSTDMLNYTQCIQSSIMKTSTVTLRQ